MVGTAANVRSGRSSKANGSAGPLLTRSQSLVVLPTYNERPNLESVVRAVVERGHDVLIVDDNSPDGTGDLADRLSVSLEGVNVLHRAHKLGLGSAYLEGFRIGLEQGYEFILEMDADGSHLPDDLQRLIDAAGASNGLAIGSRYIRGGTIIGWSAQRRVLSTVANVYCRLLLSHRVHDWTSGFRCYSSRALKTVGLQTILSSGFDFQIEMAFQCLQHDVPVKEVPIQFKERELGQSKASGAEINMGLSRVARLRWARSSRPAVHDLTMDHGTTAALQPIAARPLELNGAGGHDHPLQSAVIGVLVHNEDPTIETCLRAVLAERDGSDHVRSVLVIASGCTDQTVKIVKRIADGDSRVQLIVEPRRTGKAAAINLLLRESTAPIVVSLGGDVVFTPGSLVRLLEPFGDPSVGMTGARPVPTNPRSGLLGRAVNVLWDLHHELSLQQPKLGEAVAFRRVVHEIDRNTLVDEATMEHLMKSCGLKLQYVPTAIVRNHGPETVREFVAQRSRVYSGHLSLARSTGYRVSSMSKRASLRAAWRLWRRGENASSIALVMSLEAIARGRARLAQIGGRAKHNGLWHPIGTSKRVVNHGHVLRSHHESIQILKSPPHSAVGGRRPRWSRKRVAMYRALVRGDDRISIDRGRLTIAFRSDDEGALALRDRLDSNVPGTEHVRGETRLPRPHKPSSPKV